MQPAIISIPTLSGGVSRQPASRRTAFEAEELDNCLVTLERSIEKRPGFTVLSGSGGYDLSFLPSSAKPEFVWFQVDRERRFLIIVDRSAVNPAANLIYIMKVSDNSWTSVTPANQWDPTDADLAVVDDADTASIDSDDVRYPVKVAAASYGDNNTKAVYDQALANGILSRVSRDYVVYSSDKTLKTLQTGLNLLFLNTAVKAGFTSGTSGKTVDFTGAETDIDDVIGAKVTYFTSAKVSKVSGDSRLYYDASFPAALTKDPNLTNKFIPVEDFIYGDFESPWLGQSVAAFNELRFPPDLNDWFANNGNPDTSDTSAADMLKLLYDSKTEYAGTIDGNGKIYFCDGPYLEMRSGYYRIVSFPEGLESTAHSGPAVDGAGVPYTQRVRTPDYCSVIDKNRMPQRLTYTDTGWTLQPVDWTPRLNGDRDSNPGPSPFMENDEAVHVEINSLCNFRDRIFFSARDVVFSSRLGDLENLWLDDPSNITYIDPIDIRAASNTYSEITAMLPFNKYMFINSRGSVQFELKGDDNVISPLTAEISSTTFYTTLEGTDPVTLGSQIYFYAPSRLYVYFNADSREFNTALELSSTIPDYLPTNIGSICVATSQNYVIAVDADAKQNIYIYGNRFSSNEIVQSAFWRYVLPQDVEAYSINVWDNYLYAVVKTSTDGDRWFIYKNLLEREDVDVPRLDGMLCFTLSAGSINEETEQITIPYILPDGNVYLWVEGEMIELTERENSAGQSIFYYGGIDITQYYGKAVYVGVGFRMLARLSTVLYRADNQVVEGVLNLKTMTTRHHNTGSYKVVATRLNRTNPLESEFSATNLTDSGYIDVDGIFVSKIFGVSEDTVIDIINDTPSPCNITQIEFRSIFNRKNSSKR